VLLNSTNGFESGKQVFSSRGVFKDFHFEWKKGRTKIQIKGFFHRKLVSLGSSEI